MKCRISILVCLILLFAAVPAAPQDETSGVPAAVPESVKAGLDSLFKGITEADLQPVGGPSFFGENLYEYIDGAAELFRQYGFRALIHRIYEAGPAEVTVDVYDMAEPLNAFGIYSAERSPDYRFVPVGLEGYGDAGTFTFTQGPWYAKLSLYQEGEPDSTLLLGIAQKLSPGMGPVGSFPPVFSSFPQKGLVPHSERYVRESPLGYSDLGSAYSADYSADGQTLQLLAAPAGSPQEAVKRVEKLRAHFHETGRVVPLAGFGPEAFSGSNDYEGEVSAAAAGSNVLISLGPPEKTAALIRALHEKLMKE
jgi:hypothetical protein